MNILILEKYILKLRNLQVPEDKIKKQLLAAGWDESIIESTMYPPAPTPNDTSESDVGLASVSMWDAFEHILLFISLYVLSISIGLMMYFFIDEWFPAISAYSSSGSWKYSSLRGYMASIIVSYPLFSFFFWRVTQRTMKNPLLRSLKARKFLIYLTLVVTFVIMVGFIIGTIYSFLSGDLTLNFILHLIATLLISGIIFAYYLQQVKEDRQYAKI